MSVVLVERLVRMLRGEQAERVVILESRGFFARGASVRPWVEGGQNFIGPETRCSGSLWLRKKFSKISTASKLTDLHHRPHHPLHHLLAGPISKRHYVDVSRHRHVEAAQSRSIRGVVNQQKVSGFVLSGKKTDGSSWLSCKLNLRRTGVDTISLALQHCKA